LCFRARSREDVDAIHRFLVDVLRARVVHPPEDGSQFAPGYYSVLFEDPDGIRVEVNHVPGQGHLGPGGRLGPGGAGPAGGCRRGVGERGPGGWGRRVSGTVETTVNYLGEMRERPFFYVHEPPPGMPWRNTRPDRRTIAVRDARGLVPGPSLDVEGFLLAAH